MIDWNIVAIISAPTLTLFVGAWLNRILERRPRLVTYYVHVSAFRTGGEKPLNVYTHSIVVRNSGRKSAENVCIGHKQLPDFNIHPAIDYQVSDLPNGSKEIRIPRLVPGEEISISYLYFPPMTWQDINTYVKSDAGFAERVELQHIRKLPTWANVIIGILLLIGAVAFIYLLILFIKWFAGLY